MNSRIWNDLKVNRSRFSSFKVSFLDVAIQLWRAGFYAIFSGFFRKANLGRFFMKMWVATDSQLVQQQSGAAARPELNSIGPGRQSYS